jgi:hypothetical protein
MQAGGPEYTNPCRSPRIPLHSIGLCSVNCIGKDQLFAWRHHSMSWILSRKYRFIFIHIPKTGGTSIADPAYADMKRGALVEFLGPGDIVQQGHVRAVGLRDQLGDDWDHFFKFAFVRNPWDRLVSLYHYFLQDDEKIKSPLGRRIACCGSFIEFCKQLNTLDLDPHFDPQVSYLIDYEGNLLLDYVGRFESMDTQFKQICDHLGIPAKPLPHYRKSRHQDYRTYYDDESREIVAKRYWSDIKSFNYNF